MGLETSIHPFSSHPSWRALEPLSPMERVTKLKEDASLRRSLIEDRPSDGHTNWMAAALDKSYELLDPPDYEPHPSETITRRAERAGRDRWDLALELLLQEEGKGFLLFPFENYSGGSLEVVREMLLDDNTICGLGDAGAHVATICDASYPTFLLTHWARDRRRGEGLGLEALVAKQTGKTAASYGLLDRGILAPGYRADINLIDFSALSVRRPELVYDLPSGGRRFIQRAVGYKHTFVSGIEVMCNGEHTGEFPGQLVRGEQRRPNQ